ncbi:unnamed protein product [Trichobilharzia szidati]|nr:unnamed protein product [Trichobilharzia szidati]
MDTPKAKKLMDQYFQRLRRILSRTCDSSAVTSNKYENISTERTVCPKATKWNSASLSARVRFMVEDLIDLRENNWIPRRAGQRTETNKPRLLRDIRFEILKESGILVAPTPSERSAEQPDIPGSAFMNHSSRSSNSSVSNEFPFARGLGSNSLKNDNGEARSWMELARMGEELCRQSSRDLCLLDNGNRSTDGPTIPFHGRLHTTRRFASSKNELPNSNSVQRQSTKTNNTDSWAAKIEKPEGSCDVGWVRGVNARIRNTAVTPSNGVPTPNANLPPRMLRKLAAEAVGNPPVSSTTNAYNEMKHSTHLEVHSSHANIISGNSTTVSRNGPSHITPIIHSLGQSHSSNLFDDNPMVTSDEKFGSQKLVWPSFSKFPANSTAYGNTQSTLTSMPQSFNSSTLRTLDQPSFQNAQSLTANKCYQRIEQVRPSSTNCSAPSPNHVAENHLTLPQAPDDKKIAAKLLELLVELRDPVSIKNHLNLSNVGRITVEVLAIVVLHLCEEGTHLKLAEAEPFELAELLVACAENLLCRDASVCNSKDSRKPKSVKSLGGHPLALVWSHLLNKVLCVTQLIYSKSKIASISAALIWNRHMDLSEFAEPLRGGKHHPLFLLVLQKLSQMVDNDYNSNGKESVCIDGATVDERRCSLIQLFQDTGLQINQMVPEGSRTNEALLALLEERDLDFLVPSLRLSIELSNLMMNISDMEGKNPQESDKHFASRLDEYLSKQPATSVGIRNSDYAHACLPVVYEYIYKVGVVELGSSSSPSTLMTRERAAWKCIVPKALADILRNSVERQLDALHALQLFWVEKSMPKGFLFRCFMNLYDCELVSENAFLSWKEEVNPSYPEKGQALFEVNRWLTWLETAEEEDDEGPSKSDSNEEPTKPSVEEVAMHLENLSTACSQQTISMDHISEMVSDIIPPVLHSSSAALGSS